MLQNPHYRRALPICLTNTGQELHGLGAAIGISVTKVAVMTRASVIQVLHVKMVFDIISVRKHQSIQVSVDYRTKVSVSSI